MKCSVNSPEASDHARRISRLYDRTPRSPGASTRCFLTGSLMQANHSPMLQTRNFPNPWSGERCDTSCHFCCTKTFDGNIA